ncbi:Glucosaminyl phosphatidylinositol (GlcN-PI) nositol acylation protein [Exophiala dermatitidis]|uniref:GPI-anchored wall transfer protein 1 n=1 Tax=Exophiala dermatitidis TaxID=5970 RepID=A0AAN6EW83_EXODE|nr:Glucosaminyl phosphatidylinositol (GlcN-PI) nositol acylation protein [Exophiala dermatitidis]KAJ4524385.1 Glucosaminyl phosphatidylinositol (GlcN-PI) nositol acylation protein [Exophiala dermatitidis]KAJ4525344.1 Glucosaminyl phosphatidylinositol (GlcN-PI) nositol acylation protein [Exophiala dermatitidis]KAJ4536656.1 Glucosaminyl phosphatidylinositol (GlcN-PI) nositol acylation protein [Exophiala dermatitidis]KAJ4555742.1 Glucosaminyl phosphatidylinositol (GlcN-PI) nositol acylation protei
MADSSAIYKARKEAFVSNLSGSSLTEINLVTLVAGSAVLLWTALQKTQSFFTPYTPIAAAADFLLNVCAILFAITIYASAPLVLNIFLISPAIFVILFNRATTTKSKSKSKAKAKATSTSKSQPKPQLNSSATPSPSSNVTINSSSSSPSSSSRRWRSLPVRPFLTHYRGSMLVVTCLAILAVDFPIFPRRFAKVETWGTSLMDLGVGSFVFSAGVVSARALVKAEEQSSQSTPDAAFISRLSKSIRHSLPLFLLGLIRLWSVKGLDYAEHVTEYGVHWNFFFTLCFLAPFVEIFDLVARKLRYRYDSLAVALAVVYELLLDKTELLKYIISAPRGPDFLSMNREGVFSFVGYLAIFLCGRGTGMRVVRFRGEEAAAALADANAAAGAGGGGWWTGGGGGTAGKNAKQGQPDITDPVELTRLERRVVLKDLLVQSLIYSALYYLSTDFLFFNLNVSRRLANLPYVLWVAAFNNAQIFGFGLIEACGVEFGYGGGGGGGPTTGLHRGGRAAGQDVVRGGKEEETEEGEGGDVQDQTTSRILRAFNNNGLLVFLVANLLTGLVNLTLNTLDTPPTYAMAVMLAYAGAVTAVAMGLEVSGVKIRI